MRSEKDGIGLLAKLEYLYIVVRNAVRKSDTFFIQSTKNQHLGHSKRSAKCGAKYDAARSMPRHAIS